MIRKILGLVFAAILVIACVFKAILAVVGFAIVLFAWLVSEIEMSNNKALMKIHELCDSLNTVTTQ